MRPQVESEFFRGLLCALVMVIPFWLLVIAGTIWLLND